MKNIIIILIIFFVFLSSCYYEDEAHDPLRDVIIGEMDDYKFDDSDIKVNNINEITQWIQNNITYKADEPGHDYWQLPEETVKLGTGDCEDFCILFMYLLKEKLGIDSESVLVRRPNSLDHIIIYIPSINEYIDYKGYIYTNKIFNIYNISKIWNCIYPKIIWMTYYYHNNVGIYY